jgi:hypothetical protein
MWFVCVIFGWSMTRSTSLNRLEHYWVSQPPTPGRAVIGDGADCAYPERIANSD